MNAKIKVKKLNRESYDISSIYEYFYEYYQKKFRTYILTLKDEF
jgi:hypothetical protein